MIRLLKSHFFVLIKWSCLAIYNYFFGWRQNTPVAQSGERFLFPAFSKKSGGTLFSAFRGAWCLARGAWFWVFSRYLVPLTPPTVFVRSFWNFTGVLKMVWRYAYDFFRILKLFFITLYTFWTYIFWVLILQKSIGSRYLVPLTPPPVFGRSFWNFIWTFRMAWRYACGFFRILKQFFITFSAFLI